jgi:hypothetical protein
MRLAAPEEDLRFTEPNVKWQEEQGESLIQPRLRLLRKISNENRRFS